MSARPFKTVKEMDDCLISEINEVVDRRDELYILGDYTWLRPGHYRQRINCRTVHLIWGNHDKDNYKLHFSTVDDVKMVKLREQATLVFLSHYPHAFWPNSHHGSCHLYGHMHRQREEWLDRALGNQRRSMDVGVDNIAHLTGHYRPISEVEVAGILLARTGHDDVSYYTTFQKALHEQFSNAPGTHNPTTSQDNQDGHILNASNR